ncbi:response regulator [Spirosoma endophyticum]|uniref:CheY chemotaxis protein or a CheY-like REC (Receiver) domain n=1 Tax=Spirosoma endophyticum TaxID=662367 RepID=A0A1I2EAR6_9BACT|nr:response regulator [Spirosoma endophyticum]SFE89955.1 CheY chemotaxis protein or a CheY-like REC (receiver) domain [Spirosoma endophyticum]
MSKSVTAVQANFRNAKVLIVEDDEDQWVLMDQAWQQCLGEVTLRRVSSLPAVMSLLEEWHHQEWELPKLILLDLYLPGKEAGWQFLQKVKAMPSIVSLIPIIIHSSAPMQADIIKSYSLGTSAYLVKPVDFAEWLTYFGELRAYWWETVTLPPMSYGL